MMSIARWTVAFGIGTAALASVPAFSHHSFAMFDQSKQVEFGDATVARFEWKNPHAFLVVRRGATVYTLECSSPNLMTHAGWTHNTLKPGDRIDVVFHPLRNGRTGGMLRTVTLPDGRELSAW
jgi:hypothetical protein